MLSNHRVLSFACLVFGTNVAAARCCEDPWLPAAWFFVLLTSIYHHHAPTVRVLTWIDKTAVYNLVVQNGRYAFLCPNWVVFFYIGTVVYSASWYYTAKCVQRQQLYFHILMYALTSVSGHCIILYQNSCQLLLSPVTSN